MCSKYLQAAAVAAETLAGLHDWQTRWLLAEEVCMSWLAISDIERWHWDVTDVSLSKQRETLPGEHAGEVYPQARSRSG